MSEQIIADRTKEREGYLFTEDSMCNTIAVSVHCGDNHWSHNLREDKETDIIRILTDIVDCTDAVKRGDEFVVAIPNQPVIVARRAAQVEVLYTLDRERR